MLGATFVTEKVIQRNNVLHPAGYAMNQVTGTWIAQREKIEEGVKVGEEEEMNPILVRGDNQRKGGIHLMPKRKAIRCQVKVTGLGTIVQVSLVQTRIDPVSQDPDIILKINENEIKNKNETKQQQQQQTIDNKQKQNNEAGKTITNLKKKTIDDKTEPKPSMNKTTKPKLNSTSK